MSRQERYRQRYQREYPDWIRSLDIYKKWIDEAVQSTSYFLDIGCGHGDLLKDVYAKTPHTYGIDQDEASLKKNTHIKHLTVGMADHLPYPDNFFDVVTLEWVLEHLDDPENVFREIHRVLKKDGVVIFITPNAWSFVTWMIRAIPNRFHAFLTKRLYDRQEGDTFPVRYRINTASQVKKLASKIGYSEIYTQTNGDPTYTSINELTYHISRCIERVLNAPMLHFARVHLIGKLRK